MAIKIISKQEELNEAIDTVSGMVRFQHLLASRAIPVHYDIEDFEQDLVALRKLGRIV